MFTHCVQLYLLEYNHSPSCIVLHSVLQYWGVLQWTVFRPTKILSFLLYPTLSESKVGFAPHISRSPPPPHRISSRWLCSSEETWNWSQQYVIDEALTIALLSYLRVITTCRDSPESVRFSARPCVRLSVCLSPTLRPSLGETRCRLNNDETVRDEQQPSAFFSTSALLCFRVSLLIRSEFLSVFLFSFLFVIFFFFFLFFLPFFLS